MLSKIPEADWQVFSKHANSSVTIDHIDIHPVHNGNFLQSLTSCRAFCAEPDLKHRQKPYILGKKLMVIPMQNQYEQAYTTPPHSKVWVYLYSGNSSHPRQQGSAEWVSSDYKIEISYPDMTEQVIKRIFEMFVDGKFPRTKWPDKFEIIPDS